MFNWREDIIDNKIRIYFLSSFDHQSEITLIYCDVVVDKTLEMKDQTKSAQPQATTSFNPACDHVMKSEDSIEEQELFMPMTGLEEGDNQEQSKNNDDIKPIWLPLIAMSRPLQDIKHSREENLQLERKRIMLSGITSYEYHPQAHRFVFTSGDTLYWFDDVMSEGDKMPPYLPNKIDSGFDFIKMNPQMCPSNHNLVAYVSDGDVWVCNLLNGLEIRLTDVKLNRGNKIVAAGLPPYVIQEEFRRYTGFWWRPQNHHFNDTEETYSILFEIVDETDVDVVKISSWDGNIEEYRFPRAGQKNAKSYLKIVNFCFNKNTNLISKIQTIDIPSSLNQIFYDFEYLIKANWFDRDNIVLQLLNRRQDHLVLVLASLNDVFPAQIIYEEKSKLWINCHDILHFFPIEKQPCIGTEIKFIWSSEETGFRHLYLITIKLTDKIEEQEEHETDERISLNSLSSEEVVTPKLPKLDYGTDLELTSPISNYGNADQ